MRPKRSMDLTTGSVPKKLILFTLPILATNLLQHLYHTADKAVVGNFAENGKIALAAVGATGSATNFIINLFIGLALGANIVCSNLRGGKRHTELRQCMHTALIIAAATGVVVCTIGLLVSRSMLQLMNCPADILDSATLYMRLIFCGTPLSLMYNFSSAILRSHGDTQRPMMILTVSGFVNVVLNLVFVVGFHLDVAGVALATVLSHVVSCVWVLCILFNPKGEYRMSMSELRLSKNQLKSILRVGIPCGINSSVFSLSNATVQSAMNTFSSAAVAGNTAADSVVILSYQTVTAFYSGCVSFSGQCYGAHRHDRIKKLLRTSMLVSILLSTAIAVIATIVPTPILALFNQDPEVIRYGTTKLIIVSWSYLLYGVSEMFLGCLRGMKRTTIPTVLNVLFVCILRVAWVFFVFPQFKTLLSLYICYPISYSCSAIALGIYYGYTIKKVQKELQPAT